MSDLSGSDNAVRAAEEIARDAATPPQQRIPEWPRTAFVEWTHFPPQRVEPVAEEPYDVPEMYRAQLVTQHNGKVTVAQMMMTLVDIEDNKHDLITFISVITHQAYLQIVDAIEGTDGEN